MERRVFWQCCPCWGWGKSAISPCSYVTTHRWQTTLSPLNIYWEKKKIMEEIQLSIRKLMNSAAYLILTSWIWDSLPCSVFSWWIWTYVSCFARDECGGVHFHFPMKKHFIILQKVPGLLKYFFSEVYDSSIFLPLFPIVYPYMFL